MKKAIVLGVIIILISLIGYKYLEQLINQPCDPPTKPLNVPAKAKWYGGCDGGNWIELISISDKKYRFKVYRDWDGTLNMDADFISENCINLSLTTENWEELVTYYIQDDSSVYITIRNETNCRLKSVYPAYGGEDWKMLQEKE